MPSNHGFAHALTGKNSLVRYGKWGGRGNSAYDQRKVKYCKNWHEIYNLILVKQLPSAGGLGVRDLLLFNKALPRNW